MVRAQQDLISDLRLQLERAEERLRSQQREIVSLKETADTALQSEARTQRHYQELVERMRMEHAHMIKVL